MVYTRYIAVGDSKEATAPDAVKAAVAEFIGTFLFVFLGLGSACAYYKIHPEPDLSVAGMIVIAIAHGLALAVTVAATANLSGGHINPAVTLALIISGNITVVRGVLYWIGQLAGAVLAAVLLKYAVVTGEPVPIHAPGLGVGIIGSLVVETVLTFALVFVIFASAVDPKKGAVGVIAPLAIGFTVLAGIFVGAPYSGASMNPARSFGPAVANLNFTCNWIYWLGPFIGATLAALVYDVLFLTPEADREATSNNDDYT